MGNRLIQRGTVMLLLLPLAAGCSAGPKPCVDDLGCVAGQICVSGHCAPGKRDSGQADGGSGDAGAADSGTPDAGAPDAGRSGPDVTVTPGRPDYRDGSVQLDSNFVITFSTDMDAGSVQVAASPPVSHTLSWTVDELRDVVFQPDAELAPATTYTLSVTGTSLTGDAITPPYQFVFHTQATPDRTPPTIVSTTPSHNATGVDATTKFSVTFSEPMFEVVVVPTPLVDLGVPTVTDGVTYSYELGADWSPATTYDLFVNGYDLNSNPVAQHVTFSVACVPQGSACTQSSECCLGTCVDGGCP